MVQAHLPWDEIAAIWQSDERAEIFGLQVESLFIYRPTVEEAERLAELEGLSRAELVQAYKEATGDTKTKSRTDTQLAWAIISAERSGA